MSMGILLGNDIDLAFKQRAFCYFNAGSLNIRMHICPRKNRYALGRSHRPIEST